MFRKSIIGSLAIAAVAAAAVAYKAVKDRQNDVEEEDDEIHFIEINDEEEEERSDEEEEPQPVTADTDDEHEDDQLHIPNFQNVTVDKDWETHEEGPVSEEVKEIMDIYPYLSAKFIQDLLDHNDAMNEEFPENTLVSANHTVQFENEEKLVQFETIMLDAQYNVVAKKDGKITVNKRFFSESGAIISDILNVSNQAVALQGEYLGYELN